MKKVLASLVLGITYFVLVAHLITVQAQYANPPPPSTNLMIEKMVGVPNQTKGSQNICDGTVNFYNNFSASDAAFHAGDYVCFRIRVKNIGTGFISNVVVADYLPAYLTPSAGPGTFNNTNRTITFNVNNLDPQEESINYLQMQVSQQNQLPTNTGLFCLVNRADGNADNTFTDSSTSQFCIASNIVTPTNIIYPTPIVTVPMTKGGIPSTGPEMGVFLFGGELSALGLGIYLKRKVKSLYSN